MVLAIGLERGRMLSQGAELQRSLTRLFIPVALGLLILGSPSGPAWAEGRTDLDLLKVPVLELPFLGSVYRHHGDRERYRTEILFWLHIEGERKAGFSP
jgi:hypothetical protein